MIIFSGKEASKKCDAFEPLIVKPLSVFCPRPIDCYSSVWSPLVNAWLCSRYGGTVKMRSLLASRRFNRIRQWFCTFTYNSESLPNTCSTWRVFLSVSWFPLRQNVVLNECYRGKRTELNVLKTNWSFSQERYGKFEVVNCMPFFPLFKLHNIEVQDCLSYVYWTKFKHSTLD